MKGSNKVFSQMINSANDSDYLHRGIYQDDSYAGAPSAKRWKVVEQEVETKHEPSGAPLVELTEDKRKEVLVFFWNKIKTREAYLFEHRP